jgi:hypothetical protein
MNRPFKSTPAVQVKPGDTVIFDTPRWDVVIEEAEPMSTDGWTILRANNDTWSLALKNTDTVRVLQQATA